MKLELPLAVVLLAAGSLLWNARSSRSSWSSQTGENTVAKGMDSQSASLSSQGRRSNSGDPTGAVDSTSVDRIDRYVTPASFTATELPANDVPNPGLQSPPATNVPAGNLQAAQLVQQSASNLLNSVPIEARARVTINLFDRPLVANGRYYQQGQGTNKARLELAHGEGENAIQTMQLCDGRFHYSQQTMGTAKRLEFIDLEKVSQASQPAVSYIADPGNPLSTGSISSLMQNLALWFDFESPVQTELGGISMISIKGHWKPSVVKAFVADLVDPDFLEPEINWNKIPAQIPHSVEVTLGNDQFLPLFPYRIVFHQNGAKTGASDQGVLQLELFEVGKLNQLSEQIFNIDSEDVQPFDATERYVHRVQQYGSMNEKALQASKDLDTTRR